METHTQMFVSRRLYYTSNKAFSEWGSVFAGDPVMAAAALDRLLHRCTVINIRGDSYRLKEKRSAGAIEIPKEEKSTKKTKRAESE